MAQNIVAGARFRPEIFFFIDYRASPKNNDDAFIDGVYVVNVHSRLVKF